MMQDASHTLPGQTYSMHKCFSYRPLAPFHHQLEHILSLRRHGLHNTEANAFCLLISPWNCYIDILNCHTGCCRACLQL